MVELEIGRDHVSPKGLVKILGALLIMGGLIAMMAAGASAKSGSAGYVGGLLVVLGIGALYASGRFAVKKGLLRLGDEAIETAIGKKTQRVAWADVTRVEWTFNADMGASGGLAGMAVRKLAEQATDGWFVKLYGTSKKELLLLTGGTFHAPVEARRALEAAFDARPDIAQSGRK